MQKTLDAILAGPREFQKNYTGKANIMDRLATEGQQPSTLVIACADSRVDPALVLQCDPGDIFVVRNVANMVPAYEQRHMDSVGAALEYAVCYLGVAHIVIMGHSGCGGVAALCNPSSLHQDDCISRWVSLSGVKANGGAVDDCAKQSLSVSYENCQSYPWIQQRVSDGSLTLHRWFFDIQRGQINVWTPESEEFIPLVAD